MRQTYFAATLAVVITACGTAIQVSAEPPPVVPVSDVSVDSAWIGFEDNVEPCGCDRIGCHGECGTRDRKGSDDLYAPWTLLPELPGGVNFTGWLEVGGAAGADRTPSRSLLPLAFADRRDVTINQLYGVIERKIDATYGLDVGGRIDVLFGTDARFTEVPGLELERDGLASKWNSHTYYRLSTPQAYAEVGSGSWSAKLGHWYTTIGYETVTAPDNFFYSHAYTKLYGEPFTHTGILVKYDLNDQLSIHAAIHGGWDNFDATRERAGFLGGVNWISADERTRLAVTATTGDEINNANAFSSRSMYSVVFTHQLCNDLTYVFQHDNAWQRDDRGPGVNSEWYGVNQYLLFKLNDCWSMGARLEWFRDDDGVRVPNWVGNTGLAGNYWEATAGINWTPGTNLILRPELRWDWFDGVGNPYADGQRNDQFVAAFDAILSF